MHHIGFYSLVAFIEIISVKYLYRIFFQPFDPLYYTLLPTLCVPHYPFAESHPSRCILFSSYRSPLVVYLRLMIVRLFLSFFLVTMTSADFLQFLFVKPRLYPWEHFSVPTSDFLQIPPNNGRPCLRLTLPTAKSVADFHRQVVMHVERTHKPPQNYDYSAAVLGINFHLSEQPKEAQERAVRRRCFLRRQLSE